LRDGFCHLAADLSGFARTSARSHGKSERKQHSKDSRKTRPATRIEVMH
jgi:hypothetical protein